MNMRTVILRYVLKKMKFNVPTGTWQVESTEGTFEPQEGQVLPFEKFTFLKVQKVSPECIEFKYVDSDYYPHILTRGGEIKFENDNEGLYGTSYIMRFYLD